MARPIERDNIDDPILTPTESYELFDEQVRRVMNGMSGEEFIRRWKAGEFASVADQPGSRHIMRLALMMPVGQPKP